MNFLSICCDWRFELIEARLEIRSPPLWNVSSHLRCFSLIGLTPSDICFGLQIVHIHSTIQKGNKRNPAASISNTSRIVF